ncbi:LuxR C-terminal-related transcriptional regulator [Pseudomonas kuykendallii]|uniref:LuxR family transcriptional regulator n=1 Tax=Pseudomonas kuykendallii TaxID=1007099 RepID=A0A2W5D0S5_9PSED|nr:MAG: LuxR family transcriptional regulator [Pseudomonas kuykendallii]
MNVPLAQVSGFPLLRTKLAPMDRGQQAQLARSALVERLFAARERRLLIVSGPAGYGKSTLLGQFAGRLAASGECVAWLSCDESDSPPERLLRYLIAAIGAVCPGFGSRAMGLLDDQANWPEEALLEALIADLKTLERPLYLLLDDFHRLRHPFLGKGGRYLLERLPEHVHLVVSTRFGPLFIEDDPVLKASVFWIKAEDLRFSRDEMARYFSEVCVLELDDAQLKQLGKRCEGWITALHLAALGMRRQSDRARFIADFSGTERTLADYLEEDVLEGLPQSLLAFLEQTSLLDEFSAELCNALTGRRDALDMLLRLQSEQLFVIALDERGEWFRYHPLFAEFLQGRLDKRGDSTNLLQAAARWCESNEQSERAIGYALRARDYPHAADLLERKGAGLIAGNRVYGVLKRLEQVPAEEIREHPVFQIFYAWQLAFEQKYAEAEALIEEVSTRLMQGQGRPMHYGLAELLAAAQVLKALVMLYQDKLESCLKVSRYWLKLAPENQTVFRASLFCVQAAAFGLLGDYGEAASSIARVHENLKEVNSEYLLALTSLIEALICKESGELERGRSIAEAARGRVERVFGANSRVGGPLALAYADLLYEQDRHASILGELPAANTWRDVATPLELFSRGQLVMARTRFFSGDTRQGLGQLDAWLTGLQGAGHERVLALGMGCKVQLLLWQRQLGEAERICLQLARLMESLPAERYPDACTALALSQARLALSERRPEKAQAVLESSLAGEAAEHQRDRRLRLSLLLAVAYWRKGYLEKAFALFQVHLEDAWSRGYRRAFQDDALWLLPLWEAWKVQEPLRASAWEGLGELLRGQFARLGIDPDTIDENQDVSYREQEILRFVAAGMSNRDIAQAVHLSEATIKWHLHKLFAKMGVRSRTQAVLKGKTLGLISEG